MLILVRYEGEAIIINDDIKIKILEISHDKYTETKYVKINIKMHKEIVLVRYVDESICINENINIRILAVVASPNRRRKQVKLGIEAPREIIVHREEIYLKVKEKNEKLYRT